MGTGGVAWCEYICTSSVNAAVMVVECAAAVYCCSALSGCDIARMAADISLIAAVIISAGLDPGIFSGAGNHATESVTRRASVSVHHTVQHL